MQCQSLTPRPTGNAVRADKNSLVSGRFHSIDKGWKKVFPPFVCRREAATSLLSGKEREKPLPFGEEIGRILDAHSDLLECKNLSPGAS